MHRSMTMIVVALLVSGCTGQNGILSGMRPNFSMPSFTMPDMNVPQLLTRGGARESLQPTRPATLTEAQSQAVRQAVQEAFPTGWDVRFLRVRTGSTAGGDLVSCGVATARSPDGGSGWSGIYRTRVDPVTGEARLSEIAGGRSDRLVAYSNCQALDLA